MLKNKYLSIVIIALLGMGVFVVSWLYRQDVKYYFKYYITRVADRYGLLDYGLLAKPQHFWGINENLDLLNKKVSDLSSENGDKNLNKSLQFPAYFTDLRNTLEVSNNIKRKLYLQAMLINSLENQKKGTEQNSEPKTFNLRKNITKNKTSFEIDLPRQVEVINKKMVISNKGSKTIVNPKVIVNGKKKWFGLDSIIQSVIKPNMSEEEKALSIWVFLNNNRYHFYPATEEAELHNIVKYLNAYGYGFCDDTATNLCLLANKAGLKARVWGLGGHVVSEVYFQNDWHLLDSDHKVFYLEKDNKTIASVEDLADNPELIYRVVKNSEGLAKLYTTKENNFIGQNWTSTISAGHNMDFVLRPGESFIAFWKGNGRYISYGRFYAHEPPKYGSGWFVYTPLLKQGIFLESIFEKNNVKVISQANQPVLSADKPNQRASVVLEFKTPYPITGAIFEIDCSKKEDGDSLAVSFSKDNKKWWEITKLEGKISSTAASIKEDFTNYFPNGYAQPLYSYSLKLDFLSTKPLSLTIKRIKIITRTQLAPHSLPALENGKNIISYISDSPQAQAGEIEFHYSLGKKYRALMNPPQLISPEGNKGHILFSWNPPDKRDKNIDSIEYNFQLSLREDFLVPLAPNFDIIMEKRKFLAQKTWFNNDQIYYWRLRSRYKDEAWGKFSKPQEVVFGKL